MASIKLFFDTRRIKNDGTYPLKLKLFHKDSARYISLKYSFKKNQWTTKDCKVKPSYSNAGRTNAIIHKMLYQASNFLVEYKDEFETLTIDEVKTNISKIIFGATDKKRAQDKSAHLFEYFQNLIQRLHATKRYGSATAYKTALNSVMRYLKEEDIQLDKIDHNFLSKYEEDCKIKGLRTNSIAVYMRTLRAVINKAIDEGWLSQDSYPFRKFRIKKEPTAKRAISKEEIDKLLSLNLKKGTLLRDSQNYFAFMFNMRGMNFIDLAYLKKENIQHNRVIYQRIKTGKLFDLKLTDRAMLILKYYMKRRNLIDSDFIFPIIPEEVWGNEELERKRYIDKRKHFNKALKRLAKLAGIDANLTSYVSRHSWASIAKFSGISPSIIGESLGHSDLKTTETYLANFDHRVLDDANELVVGQTIS